MGEGLVVALGSLQSSLPLSRPTDIEAPPPSTM